MKKLLLITFIILISSCSTQRRAQRHISRAKKLDPSAFTTKTVIDTVTLETEKVETKFVQVHDTTFIQKDNLGQDIKIEYRWREFEGIPDTVEIAVDCPDQKVINNITTETVLVRPTTWQNIKSLWWAFLGLVILMILTQIRRV